MKFDFENLDVWQKAVDFANDVIDFSENLNVGRKHFRLIEQLEASSTSIAMNISEGKGRYSKKEFIHFLYIARGSLYETVTLLSIFQNRGWIIKDNFEDLITKAEKIARMINGLIASIKKSL